MTQPGDLSIPPQGVPVQGPSTYPFPRDVAAFLPWARVEDHLRDAQYYWIATVRPDGRPHATPLWGVWLEMAWYFDGAPQTRWARNLVHNPALTMHLEPGDDVVIVEGIVEHIPTMADEALAQRIIAEWDRKYGRLHPDPAGQGIWRLGPRSARAWSTIEVTDATSWRLG